MHTKGVVDAFGRNAMDPTSQGTVPAPWFTWMFWQYTTTGDGAAFGMDMNYYNPGHGFDDLILKPPSRPSQTTLPILTDSGKLAVLWPAHCRKIRLSINSLKYGLQRRTYLGGPQGVTKLIWLTQTSP
jgi:hypothetical protein